MRSLRGAGLAVALVRVGYRRPYLTVVVGIAVVALGVVLGVRITFETDVMSLVPRHDPVVEGFTRTFEEFGSLDTLLAAVPVAGDDELDRALMLVDLVAEEFRDSPYLTNVQSRLEDPTRLAEAVLHHAVLFLDEDGLARLAERLRPEGLAARAADMRAALETPLSLVAKEFMVRDPLGLLPLLLGRVSRTPSTLKVDFASGYYLAADHSMALILAKPTRPAQDIAFNEALFADLEERIARARARVAEEEEIELDRVPPVHLGGGHRIGLEDASLIRSDIITNSVTSIIGVMLLFFLAYRRFAAAHFAFLPLAVGLALTFVFTALALGRLNSATSSFSALLVGLGIDFTIVMYGRYLEARHRGLSLAEALEEMGERSGPAVLLGAITSVGTFYAFLVTRFAGLRELGLLTGTGIVLMAISAFMLLPALVTIFDGGRRPPELSRWLHVAPVLRWCGAHRRAVLGVAAALTIASLAVVGRVRFDDDVRNLRSPANRGVEVQQMVADAFGISFNAMMIRIEGGSEAEALAGVQRLAQGLELLVERGEISSFESLANLFPPADTQAKTLAWLATHATLTDPQRVRHEFVAAMTRAGLQPEAFAPGLALLDEVLRPAGGVGLEVWRGTPVERFVERSLLHRDGRVITVVNVFVPPGRWRREAPPGLVALVGQVEGAMLTGVNVVSQRLRHVVWRDAGVACLVGLVVVFFMLLWEMKRARDALLGLLPVILSVLWTVAGMALLGLALNFLNVFVITMIIGIGVDYGIHMIHRVREGGGVEKVAETARAVVFASLTTVVGFGSLVTSHFPGLRSIGAMTSAGVVLACLVAVALLPLLVQEKAGSKGP